MIYNANQSVTDDNVAHVKAALEQLEAVEHDNWLPDVKSAKYLLRGMLKEFDKYKKWGDTDSCGGVASVVTYPENCCWDFLRNHTGETWLQFQFSTGGFLFGDDYDRELFEEFFFNFIMSVYHGDLDRSNNVVIFDAEHAHEAIESYKKLREEYAAKYRQRVQERRVEELRATLRKAEAALSSSGPDKEDSDAER